MCGIAGVINYHTVNLECFKVSLQHRGPDAQTIFTKNNVALLHTRLAIQDIQHGTQPFYYQAYSIIFNGEIYNHLELRQQLKEFTFSTTSDTETLLYLYIKFGDKMYDLIDGMYAFCIYDEVKNRLVLARDRAGKKPLYYFKNREQFLFASEINALKSIRKFDISAQAITCYLRLGYVYGSFTAYDQLFELEAGSYLVVDITTLEVTRKKYFDILRYYEQPKLKLDLNEATELIEAKLKKSVEDRVSASEVEVGAFLSGGIDSGLVVALAAQFRPKIKTFTVKFAGSYDESALARLVAQQYQTEHIELEIHTDLANDVEKILLAYGEPFMDSSAIPSYYVSKAARQYVKVVLNGDGADELFGGYRRYVMAANKLLHCLKYFAGVLKFLPKPRHKQSLYNYFYRAISAVNKTGLDYYVAATSDIYEDILQFYSYDKLLSCASNFVNTVYQNKNISSALAKLMYLDFNLLLFSNLLIKMDIAAMANSLEARSPFLSKYLLEFVPQLFSFF